MVADLCGISPHHGIEPMVIAYDPAAQGRQIALPGIAQHHIDRRSKNFSADLSKLLSDEKVDVLHAQGHIAGALAAHAMKEVPSIVTLHIALGQGWRWLPSIVRGLRRAQSVTAVSDDLARRFRPWSNKPIMVVPPGIDLRQYRPPGSRNLCQPITLGIAARLHPVKRHRDVFEALRLLQDRGVPCRLLVAGQGPEEVSLRSAAKGLNVEFSGDVSDIATWLKRLDAFVLPSDHEGTPLALIEALATGLPCIATDVGGVRNLLGDAGVLIARRNPAAIASAVEQLINQPGLRLQLRNAALARAEHFSLAQRALPLLGLYHRLGAPSEARTGVNGG